MRLVGRLTAFVDALRAAGLTVSLAEAVDAGRALTVTPLMDREALRAAFAATLCKRAAHRTTFDVLFDLWFPPSMGTSGSEYADPLADSHTESAPPEEAPPPDAEALREALRRLLLDGDEVGLRRLAREAVEALGRADAQPGRQSWFGYRVLRQLSPQTLMASLLEEVLHGQERGGLAERVARQTIEERIKQFEELVDAEIRRLLAEDRGPEAVAKTAVKPLVEQVDFLRATRADLAELRRQVHPLARRLATRLTAKRRLGRAGKLDFRRTVRASLGSGGVPIETKHRPHKPHKPELVVLCDVSGSVTSFAHFTLLLAYALRSQFTKVRAFAFVDTCDEVTRFFTDGDDVVDAMGRVAAEANVVWFDGHSDYGHSFEVFADRFRDAITPRTALLVLGDARNNYRSTGLQTLKHLVEESRHAYWLNPEPAQYWGSGDSAATAYSQVIEMVECRNADQLKNFVERLLPV
jgi:prepilin-type processing-associated H-X9-DG protein